MEPITTDEPKDKFLHKVQKLCKDNGAVFILDEMITGFRVDLKGAMKYFDIIPDLCTFGKGIANGFSVAALMGKREIMELGGIKDAGKERLFLLSTTHGAEMSGLGALVETINIIKEENVINNLWSYGRKLIDGMNSISSTLGLLNQFSVVGLPATPNYVCKDAEGVVSMEFRTLFSQEMIKNNILMPWIALSNSHTQNELNLTLQAVENVLKVYKKALSDGINNYLVGPSIKPVFRKYN